MSDEGTTNGNRTGGSPSGHTGGSSGAAKTKAAIALLISLLVAAIAALSYAVLTDDDGVAGTDTAAAGPWSAIFLTSGQVYFGHLDTSNDDTFKLQDIYYLQVQQALQPGPEGPGAQNEQVSLAKLGKFELHCPVDEMFINRDQVLFWEKLQPESRVVQAITEYVKTPDYEKGCYEGVAPATPPSAAPATPPSAAPATPPSAAPAAPGTSAPTTRR